MTFSNSEFWLPISAALLLLAPLAWRAWRGAGGGSLGRQFGLAARVIGILLLLFALADPQVISERPIRGANVLAVLADNSAGLRIKDDAAILDRGETLRQTLSGRQSEWLEQLGEEYQLRNYRFDSSLQRVASFEGLSFDGDRSNLAQALAEASSRLSNLPLAGIALFTDGNATDAALFPEDLSHLPPVFPIVVGSADRLPDLALDYASLTQSAFGDAPLQLKASVAGQSRGRSTVEARLTRLPTREVGQSSLRSSSSQTVERKQISLASGEDEQTLSFEWRSSEAGIQFFELNVSRILESPTDDAQEATLQNNRRLLVADRGADRYRILYLAGRPNWEYKFLNRSLQQDPQLDLVGLVRVASREPKFEFKGRAGESGNPLYRGFGREDENERFDQPVLIRMNTRDENELRTGFPNDAATLFSYDAIVIDDLEANFFSFSQLALLREFVKQRGGGLLLLGGVNSLEDGGYRDSPLAQALPLYLDRDRDRAARSLDQAVAWSLTRDGWVEPWMRIRPNEAAERARLDNMPLFRVYNTLARVKPGARVLAEIEDAAALSYPALVTRNFGSGRVASLSVGDLWRWGLQDPGSQADLAQFWRQISRWLVKDNPRRVELSTNLSSAQGATLTAVARDEDFRPLQLGSATVFIERVSQSESGEALSLELPMKPVSNRPGQFELELPLDETGAYLARVEVTDADGVVVGQAESGWVAQPLVDEFASLSPNRALLERIAVQTGGRVLELDAVSQLAAELQQRPSPMMETWSKPLWHSNWLFLLALACFLTEWLLRRRKGLA